MEDTIYTGRPLSNKKDIDTTEKEARKKYALPITKQVIYYRVPYNDSSKPINVISYREIDQKTYDQNGKWETWYTLEITLENGEKVNIHYAFLSDMQKKNFIESMETGEECED